MFEEEGKEREHEPDLEETLRDTLRSITEESGKTTETLAKEQAAKDIAEKGEETPPATPRDRDDKGKFVAKGETPPETEAQPEVEPKKERRPAWRKGVMERFDSLDQEIRDEILKREDDFHKGIEQYKSAAQLGSTIERIAQPYLPLIQAEGGTVDRAFADLLQTAALFRTGTPEQKFQALSAIARQFNVPLPNGSGEQQPMQEQPQYNPYLPQLTALQQQLQQIQMQNQQREMELQNQQQRDTVSQIEQFMKEHDKDGWMAEMVSAPDGTQTPGQFRQIMSNALRSGQANNLSEAYELALWAHQPSRKVMLARQQSEQEKQVKRAQAVTQARKSAAANVRTRGTLPATEAGGSLEDTLRETYRKVMG